MIKSVKKIFPPCGPGTRKDRFVQSKDGFSVCDNKTGLWWEQSPNPGVFNWDGAKQYCENLTLGGKTWRLPTLQEMQWDSLIDYSVANQAEALNAGPFDNVQPAVYWSATEFAGLPAAFAWFVNFIDGNVGGSLKGLTGLAWCVSGGQDGQHGKW